MKKVLFYLPLLILTMVCVGVTSCSDDDDDKLISDNELPVAAKSFVTTYYPTATIKSTHKDKNEYKVRLSEGTEIEFNKEGEWKDVDAPWGQTVAKGFYPAVIDTYLETNMRGAGINEISKERRGYDVELLNGKDLLFSYEGELLWAE